MERVPHSFVEDLSYVLEPFVSPGEGSFIFLKKDDIQLPLLP